MDNMCEMLPWVNEKGETIGCISRREAHGGSFKLHPVVHLHLFNGNGELFLQKRPEWKDVQPGKWDTSTGGHISYNEDMRDALFREVSEELGITNFEPNFVGSYIFESKVEREFIYAFKTVYNGTVTPSAEELAGGRFWTVEEIVGAVGKGVLTPNFESEFQRFFLCKH